MNDLADIPGLVRVENSDRDDVLATVAEMTHAVYPHHQVYGPYCTIHTHVDAPAREVYEYLRDPLHLHEWSMTTRDLRPEGDLLVGTDVLTEGTRIFVKTETNDDAMTVDFHCAWDQGDRLWMIYLMRVVPAELVLGRPGCVVTWTNCHHRFYDENPHPEASPRGRAWVGDFWDMFYAGHTLELTNLKLICEHRTARREAA
ncbi:SRPBCC family protein [Pseudonocardiaceae bacterium YIM PH 21723]|nr:SRPBCC family protein [Pseudonocardiaceae bacterium YIM PH 21723]